jgi:hypothetical protein
MDGGASPEYFEYTLVYAMEHELEENKIYPFPFEASCNIFFAISRLVE